jgi:hypothetical protein
MRTIQGGKRNRRRAVKAAPGSAGSPGSLETMKLRDACSGQPAGWPLHLDRLLHLGFLLGAEPQRGQEAGICDRCVKEALASIIFSTSPGDRPAGSTPVDSAGGKEPVQSAGSFPEVVIQPSPARPANRVAAGPDRSLPPGHATREVIRMAAWVNAAPIGPWRGLTSDHYGMSVVASMILRQR